MRVVTCASGIRATAEGYPGRRAPLLLTTKIHMVPAVVRGRLRAVAPPYRPSIQRARAGEASPSRSRAQNEALVSVGVKKAMRDFVAGLGIDRGCETAGGKARPGRTGF